MTITGAPKILTTVASYIQSVLYVDFTVQVQWCTYVTGYQWILLLTADVKS